MGTKHTVLIDEDNIVYATSPCQIVEVVDEEKQTITKYFQPSLNLDDESKQLGCKLLIVDEDDFPTDEDIFDCEFDFGQSDVKKKFKPHQKHKDWKLTNKIRHDRQKAFEIGDKYQLPHLWNTLTEQQKEDYNEWRQSWLDSPQTKKEPIKPEWMA